MDVWRITVAALRRWYVLLPLLGLTALLALAAGRGVQVEYEVTGATMIVPGRESSGVPNPYGGPSDANEAVGIVLNSPAARQMLAEQGLIPTYEVAPESNSNIMNFRVRGASMDEAVETGTAVFQMAAEEMDSRQSAAGIRLVERYSIDVLQPPSVSAAVTDGRLRNIAVVGVLGAALSLAVAVLFDDLVGLVRRRRRRRKPVTETVAGTSTRREPRRPATDRPATDRPATERTVTDRPAGDRPAADGSASTPTPDVGAATASKGVSKSASKGTSKGTSKAVAPTRDPVGVSKASDSGKR